MPPRDETIRLAIEFFSNSFYPEGLTPSTAWLGFYQTLLWYEQVNYLGYTTLPHIIDANNLRPASPKVAAKWRTKRAWQRRAEALNSYLASNLECTDAEVEKLMDRLMRNIGEVQRQNSLGIAFAGLIKHFLERFGPSNIAYETEIPAKDIFPGIILPGRSEKPCIDVLVRRDALPIAVVSTKWSLRHDRLNDLTNECPIYKSAYSQVFRKTEQAHLRYYVATNEFQPSRLLKLINDPCINGVVHVHKPAVRAVAGLNGELDRLIDLPDFLQLIGRD
ncbi:hypothetical protein KKG82_06305 [Patescibacteria group bacterium]|nr:hypothetical protein [bacterium]MBU1901945.1 hypothetical protein [Patescibacteria group bacterium]